MRKQQIVVGSRQARRISKFVSVRNNRGKSAPAEWSFCECRETHNIVVVFDIRGVKRESAGTEIGVLSAK